MFYYCSFKDSNDYIYSIDMIRINFELNEHIIELDDKFNTFLNDFSFDNGCELVRYISRSGIGYHYLYKLSIEDFEFDKCSFVIGLGLNFKSENKHKGFIEFNPNKCFKLVLFNKYFERLRKLCLNMQVVRYDLAIDIPVVRSDIKMIRNLRCNYEYLNSYNSEGTILNNSITEYQGRRNHNKFTKLYDKTKESKLNYDLTRIEFTFDRDEVEYKNLPNFYYFKDDLNLLSCNDKVFLSLLLNSEDINYYLKSCSYRLRKKLEPYLSDYYLKFDLELFKKIREQVLLFEFIS